ncbi:MAG: hypothetical protein Q9183_001432 [Haloplaca sp. 2 TL-2023]
MSPTNPPNIHHPLRILVLRTDPSIPNPPLLEGSDLAFSTPYYSTTIPLWHDTISPSSHFLLEWQNEWLASEAAEVVQSIGAWILLFRKPSASKSEDGQDGGVTSMSLLQTQLRETLSTIHKTIVHHRETSNNYASIENDAILLAIGMPQPLRPLLELTTDEWEDVCHDSGGWEWIDSEATGKNDFGENVGLARLKEALEANEWDAGGVVIDGTEAADLEAELGLGNETSPTEPGIDLESDTTEMHEAILSHGPRNEGGDARSDSQVEELESMMFKLQAIKGHLCVEKGAGMSDEERKNLAAKAVRDIMESI